MAEVVETGGVQTSYTVQGEGDPLVLMHGGLSSGDHMAVLLPLAQHYRVYVADRRGHGRSPDVEGPITYERMAQDTAAFVEVLDLAPAHLVGWSDGGIVGLLVALHRPDLVHKLVMIGAYCNLEGCPDWVIQWYDELNPDHTSISILRDDYAAKSPDGPEHFAEVFDKLIGEWRSQPRLSLSELTSVRAPTLVLLGDDDVLIPAHAAAMVGAVQDGQLAVVPGTSHLVPLEKPDLVNRLVLDFLADEQVSKLMPSPSAKA